MEILKKSFKLYGTCVISSFMCFFLAITFTMVGTNLCGKQIGYSMQGELEGKEEAKILYDYRYNEGEDLKKQEYIDKGYTLTEIPVKITTVAWDVTAQVFLLFMMGVFVYNNLWSLGFKDNNLVRIGKKSEDKFKGLKIGLIAYAPSVVLLAVLTVGKTTFAKNFLIATYSFLNPSINRAMFLLGGVEGKYFNELGALEILIIFLLLMVMPIVAHIAYTLGYKSIIVSEKLIFKKKEVK